MKISVIKELEKTELKTSQLKLIERMKESLGKFEMKMLKNEIKALEKIAKKITEIEKEKKEINERGKMVISEMRKRTRAELEA